MGLTFAIAPSTPASPPDCRSTSISVSVTSVADAHNFNTNITITLDGYDSKGQFSSGVGYYHFQSKQPITHDDGEKIKEGVKPAVVVIVEQALWRMWTFPSSPPTFAVVVAGLGAPELPLIGNGNAGAGALTPLRLISTLTAIVLLSHIVGPSISSLYSHPLLSFPVLSSEKQTHTIKNSQNQLGTSNPYSHMNISTMDQLRTRIVNPYS